MKKDSTRSHCPINFALETFGDTWSLIIIRDIVFWGKKTFKEFLESDEGIATNVLASRLSHLVETGVLTKTPDEHDKRKVVYKLTEKGLDLIPMLLEMAHWAGAHDAKTTSPKGFSPYIAEHREEMFPFIRKTIRNGGSLFVGEGCVMSKVF
jgi:DNA-binding HxlR family transcriptional regulator